MKVFKQDPVAWAQGSPAVKGVFVVSCISHCYYTPRFFAGERY